MLKLKIICFLLYSISWASQKKNARVTPTKISHKDSIMSSIADNKKKALDAALSQIERQFG